MTKQAPVEPPASGTDNYCPICYSKFNRRRKSHTCSDNRSRPPGLVGHAYCPNCLRALTPVGRINHEPVCDTARCMRETGYYDSDAQCDRAPGAPMSAIAKLRGIDPPLPYVDTGWGRPPECGCGWVGTIPDSEDPKVFWPAMRLQVDDHYDKCHATDPAPDPDPDPVVEESPVTDQYQDLKRHALNALWPPLADTERSALEDSIGAIGLQVPIVTYEGKVLDGWERLQACRATGQTPTFVEYAGDNPVLGLAALNAHRRYLAPAKAARIVLEMARWRDTGVTGDAPGVTTAQVVEATGASESTVKRVKRDMRKERGEPTPAHGVKGGSIEPPKQADPEPERGFCNACNKDVIDWELHKCANPPVPNPVPAPSPAATPPTPPPSESASNASAAKRLRETSDSEFLERHEQYKAALSKAEQLLIDLREHAQATGDLQAEAMIADYFESRDQ